MGVLGAVGGQSETVEEVETQTETSVEESATQEAPERPRAEDGTFVPAANLKPEGSRRNKTKEQIQADLDQRWKSFEEKQTQERQTWQQQLEQERQLRQQQAEQLAEMRGRMEALQQFRQQSQQPAGPDPDKLFAEAEAALAAGDLRGYQQKTREAMRAETVKETEARIAAARQEWQRSQPQQIPFHVQGLLSRHNNVAMAGRDGIQAVIAEKQRLDVYRRDLTEQQREAMAWQLAEKSLAANQPQTQRAAGFDQSGAAALSGAPAARGGAPNGASGGENGVRLVGEALKAQQRSGMSPEEYVKWSDPHKYGLA